MFLQALSVKLGVVAERDLAQACRDAYPKVCSSPHPTQQGTEAFMIGLKPRSFHVLTQQLGPVLWYVRMVHELQAGKLR